MTTPVAITLNTASASTDSPAADAGDGFRLPTFWR